MEKLMDLNKETANRLWNQQFGKKQKAIDFSGREIAKAAYNDRNSKFGWNVDHILPQSRGGKTADYNLICCHILTNDQKADKFPCFVANGKEFEIRKRQNHYEIVSRSSDEDDELDENVNFLDVAQGSEFWEKCKTCAGNVFAGWVKIRVEISNESAQLFEGYEKFLIELFGTDSIFVDDQVRSYRVFGRNRVYVFTVLIGNIPTKEKAEKLLDDCVILNTYNDYFMKKTEFEEIQIVCGMEPYKSRFDMSLHYMNIMKKQLCFDVPLAINELIKNNTSAQKELKDISPRDGLYSYDYTYTKLKKNLNKLI